MKRGYTSASVIIEDLLPIQWGVRIVASVFHQSLVFSSMTQLHTPFQRNRLPHQVSSAEEDTTLERPCPGSHSWEVVAVLGSDSSRLTPSVHSVPFAR